MKVGDRVLLNVDGGIVFHTNQRAEIVRADTESGMYLLTLPNGDMFDSYEWEITPDLQYNRDIILNKLI